MKLATGRHKQSIAEEAYEKRSVGSVGFISAADAAMTAAELTAKGSAEMVEMAETEEMESVTAANDGEAIVVGTASTDASFTKSSIARDCRALAEALPKTVAESAGVSDAARNSGCDPIKAPVK